MESERIPSLPSDQDGLVRPNNPACIACDILKRRTPAVECMGYANSPCERCRTLIRKCSLTSPRHTAKGSENKDSERKWKMKGWKTLVSSRSSESGAILKELETTSNSGNKKRDRKKSDGVQDEERERARVKRVKVPGNESGSSKAPKTVMPPRLDSISGIAKSTSTYTSSNPVRRLVLVNPEDARFRQKCNLAMSPSSTVSATSTDQERHPNHHSRSSSVSSEERTCRSVLQAKIYRIQSDPLKLKPTYSPSSRMHIPTRTPIAEDGTSNLNHVRTDKDKPSGTQDEEHHQASTSKTKNTKTSLLIPSSDDVLTGAQDKSQRKSSRSDTSEPSQARDEGKRRRQEDCNTTPSSDPATAVPSSNRSIGFVHSAIDVPAQSPRHNSTRPPKAPTRSVESEPDHRTALALTTVELNTSQVAASASPATLLAAQGAHAPFSIAPERQGPSSRYHREEDQGGKCESNVSMKMRLLQEVLATQMDILETQQAMLALLD